MHVAPVLVATFALGCAIGVGGCDAVLDFRDGDAALDGSNDGALEAAPQPDATPEVSSSCVDDGCPLPSLQCEPTSGACVQCLADGDCPQPTIRCDTATHLCFQCLAPDDCPGNSTCVVSERQCVTTCDPTGGGCSPGKSCDSTRQICVACASDGDCGEDPDHPTCDVASGQCVGCLHDFQCQGGHPRCDPASFRCVACLDARDCPSGYVCDPAQHNCAKP